MTHYRDRLEAGEFAAGPSADALDELTKDELLDLARERGIPANASMSKAEIREAVERGSG